MPASDIAPRRAEGIASLFMEVFVHSGVRGPVAKSTRRSTINANRRSWEICSRPV